MKRVSHFGLIHVHLVHVWSRLAQTKRSLSLSAPKVSLLTFDRQTEQRPNEHKECVALIWIAAVIVPPIQAEGLSPEQTSLTPSMTAMVRAMRLP